MTDNAHPHKAGRVLVVHNGIIENFKTLREELAAKGCEFTSQNRHRSGGPSDRPGHAG